MCGRLRRRDEHDLPGIAGDEVEAAAGKLAGLVICAVDLIADPGFASEETTRARPEALEITAAADGPVSAGPGLRFRFDRRRGGPAPDVADGMKERLTPPSHPTPTRPYGHPTGGSTQG